MPEQANDGKSICNKSLKVEEWKKYSVKCYVLSVKLGSTRKSIRGLMVSDDLPVLAWRGLFDYSLPYDHSRFTISGISVRHSISNHQQENIELLMFDRCLNDLFHSNGFL
jgi:hypothetical protein